MLEVAVVLVGTTGNEGGTATEPGEAHQPPQASFVLQITCGAELPYASYSDSIAQVGQCCRVGEDRVREVRFTLISE